MLKFGMLILLSAINITFSCATPGSSQAKTCKYEGKTYKVGEGRKKDCNGCMCESDGGWVCSMAECLPLPSQ